MQQLNLRSFSGIYPVNYGQDSLEQLNIRRRPQNDLVSFYD